MVLMLMAMVACVEKTPDYGNFPTKDVDFTYNVDGDEFLTDFYVVSKIQFNNTSSKSGAVTWDFGDGETSTEPNPVHKYKKAGVYKVTMSLAGVGERSYPIMIYDIAPVLSVASQSAVPVVINDVTVELSIFLPNPENLKCRYEWTFPEGTTKEDGTAMTTWTGYSHEDGTIDYPGKLKFKNIGSQKIEIKTWFDIDDQDLVQPPASNTSDDEKKKTWEITTPFVPEIVVNTGIVMKSRYLKGRFYVKSYQHSSDGENPQTQCSLLPM